MTQKYTEMEIISIEEAVHDYEQAYDDYNKTLEKANENYKRDKEVFEVQLQNYFEDADIEICGTLLILHYENHRDDLSKIVKTIEDSINTDFQIECYDKYMNITVNLFEELKI